MKRLATLVFGLVLAQSSGATGALSDRLLSAVLADHFARYFCVSRFPAMRAEIQQAYDASRLRDIAVPCRALKCSNPEYSQGMQVLLEESEELSSAEAKEVCSNYRAALKSLEDQHADELDAFSRQKRQR